MSNFVEPNSVVRRVWGDSDMILLVFTGAAAEFALNRAADWLFFTNQLPLDPLGRLFSTVSYAQGIVFADEPTAQATLARIRAVHAAVEQARGSRIPAWAHRDVLYMLIDYTERAYSLLERRLTIREREEMFGVFHRLGEGLGVEELPATYAEWRADRERHLRRDLAHSQYTARLYDAYRKHLGRWRYELLLRLQALLVPTRVRKLLRLSSLEGQLPLACALRAYCLSDRRLLRPLVQRALVPPRYLDDVRRLEHEEVR